MSRSGLLLNPQLLDALRELCEEEYVDMNLRTIEDMQDFVLDCNDGREKQAIEYIIFLRNMRSVFLKIREGISQEGGEHGRE
jgi:hypothetical protein